MHNIEFGPARMRRVAIVLLGSLLWGVSLCAAQRTPEALDPDADAPPMGLREIGGLTAASFTQT
jgi:hypothetical protein